MGEPAARVDVEALCRALGIRVDTVDPFNVKKATRKIRELVDMGSGVRVLIMKRACELLRMKREKAKPMVVQVSEEKCKGLKCAVCYGLFRCPAFVKYEETGRARINETACSGCGACVNVCPSQAITVKGSAA
jgi:indolepyruvate ferredoxin oxidoreductase alpha subunit